MSFDVVWEEEEAEDDEHDKQFDEDDGPEGSSYSHATKSVVVEMPCFAQKTCHVVFVLKPVGLACLQIYNYSMN